MVAHPTLRVAARRHVDGPAASSLQRFEEALRHRTALPCQHHVDALQWCGHRVGKGTELVGLHGMQSPAYDDATISEEGRSLGSVNECSKASSALIGGVGGDVDLLDHEAAVAVNDQFIDECDHGV